MKLDIPQEDKEPAPVEYRGWVITKEKDGFSVALPDIDMDPEFVKSKDGDMRDAFNKIDELVDGA